MAGRGPSPLPLPLRAAARERVNTLVEAADRFRDAVEVHEPVVIDDADALALDLHVPQPARGLLPGALAFGQALLALGGVGRGRGQGALGRLQRDERGLELAAHAAERGGLFLAQLG